MTVMIELIHIINQGITVSAVQSNNCGQG